MGLLNKANQKARNTGLLSKIYTPNVTDGKKKSQFQGDLENKIRQIPVNPEWISGAYECISEFLGSAFGAVLITEGESNSLVFWHGTNLDATSKRKMQYPQEGLPQGPSILLTPEDLKKWTPHLSLRLAMDCENLCILPIRKEDTLYSCWLFFNFDLTKKESLDLESLANQLAPLFLQSRGGQSLSAFNPMEKPDLLQTLGDIIRENTRDHLLLKVQTSEFLNNMPNSRDLDLFRLEQELLGIIRKIGGPKARYFNCQGFLYLLLPAPKVVNHQLWISQLNMALRRVYRSDAIDVTPYSSLLLLPAGGELEERFFE